jgi:TIGR02436 family protein
MKTDNVIVDKSKTFALKVITLYKKLYDKNPEFVISKQLLKSGTSIGANIKEAEQGQSKADSYAKLYIALKEASKTEYWLELLHESGYIDEEEFCAIYQDCQEIIKILVAITKRRSNG